MCMHYMRIIYLISIANGGCRLSFIEQRLEISRDEMSVSDDDIRNEPEIYKDLFSTSCEVLVSDIYDSAMERMRGVPYEMCEPELDALAFIQEIVAVAMWRFKIGVGEKLEIFSREFDRLDVREERNRLHQSAQA